MTLGVVPQHSIPLGKNKCFFPSYDNIKRHITICHIIDCRLVSGRRI